MKFTSRITTANTTAQILEDLIKGQEDSFDLGILFLSIANQGIVRDIVQGLNSKIPIKSLIGCTSAGVIGSNDEIEHQAATVLVLAKLPDVKILPFAINQTQLEGLKTAEEWYQFFETYPNEKPTFILLPDPFLLDLNLLLGNLNRFYPGSAVAGGLASAAASPGENTLILDREQINEGAVGLVLTGNVRIETVVSQGCRPVGETFIVTRAEENLIYSLAGKPFMEVVQKMLKKLPQRDRVLAHEALFVGIATDEYKHELKRGDFLIRGLMGIDQETGAGVIADYIKTGQTVQFHLRDGETASEDLNELMLSQQLKMVNTRPQGALVFCCNGRGQSMFEEKNHDIGIIQHYMGSVPAGGFFCAGEIGPVGKQNFLHGFTNSIVLFYPLT